jgi:hypothetical protein
MAMSLRVFGRLLLKSRMLNSGLCLFVIACAGTSEAADFSWGPTYAGVPTMLSNPQAQPDFGVRSKPFGFNVTGTAGIPIVIEACAGLTGSSWVPLQSGTLTNGLMHFSDPAWGNYPARIYRIRSP